MKARELIRRCGSFLKERWPWIYALGCFAAILVFMLNDPIVAHDADLWYHLNGGRYIFGHHAIPREAFFSFLSPPRPWVDYYWLFQTLVYGIYSLSGYWGLFALKAAAFAALGGLVCWFFLRRRAGSPGLYESLLVCLYLLLLPQRCTNLRPHLFEYFFVVLSVMILDSRSRWVILLPVIAALWGNLHGVSYPVLLLICGSAVAEYFYDRFRGRPQDEGAQRRLAFCGLAMAAVFLTPHGFRLLDLPFTPLDYAQQHIGELRLLSPEQLGAWGVVDWMFVPHGLFNAIFLLSSASAVVGAWDGRLRPSHLLLWLGGIALLAKGGLRFQFEYAFLAMPLLKACPPFRRGLGRFLPAPVAALGLLLFAAVAGRSLALGFKRSGRLPVSWEGLPSGVAALLRHADVGGKVLNEPNRGGYWQWVLYPRYKIAGDMQFPFLFDNADYHLLHYAFQNKDLLGDVIRAYRPDFIVAPLWAREFPKMIRAFPDYALLFYDDNALLYADRRAHRQLVEAFGPPANPFEQDGPLVPPDGPAAVRAGVPGYLKRMIAIAPESAVTRFQAARACALDGDYHGELAYAESVLRGDSGNALAHLFKGDALQGLGRHDAALRSLKRALDLAADAARPAIYKKMEASYRALGDETHALACRHRSKGEIATDGFIAAEIAAVRAGDGSR